MRSSFTSRALLTAAVALTLGLAACSDSTSPGTGGDGGTGGNGGGTGGGLTAAQVQDVGAVASSEIDESFSVLLAPDPTDPFENVAGFQFSSPAPLVPRIPNCATTDPASPANPDADKVPTDVTIDFANCSRTGPNGASIALFGTLHLSDPHPDAAGVDFSGEANGLGYQFTNTSGGTLKVTRDGSASLTLNDASTEAVLTEDLQVSRERSDTATVSVSKKGTRTFTADQGATIQPGSERPSGTITVDGTFTYTQSSNTFNFTSQTLTPLHYNASCTDVRRGQRLDAGVIQYTRTVNGKTETLKLTFTGCGVEPTVEHTVG